MLLCAAARRGPPAATAGPARSWLGRRTSSARLAEGWRPISIYTVDSFATTAFEGNPAAVCVLDGPGHSDSWMQSVALEMNLSETAFLEPLPGAEPAFKLRWFTPTDEVRVGR